MTEYSPQWKEKSVPGAFAARDMDYFQGMYPWRIKEIQRYVIYQCDAMDYSGSPIYDEYPDVLMIEQACRAVCGMIPQNWIAGEEANGDRTEEESETEESYTAQDVEVVQNRPGGPPPPPWGPPPGGRPPWGPPPPPWGPPPGGRPPGGPPPWGPPPGSPPPHNNWLADIVKVLFMNEIQRRRCRMGRC